MLYTRHRRPALTKGVIFHWSRDQMTYVLHTHRAACNCINDAISHHCSMRPSSRTIRLYDRKTGQQRRASSCVNPTSRYFWMSFLHTLTVRGAQRRQPRHILWDHSRISELRQNSLVCKRSRHVYNSFVHILFSVAWYIASRTKLDVHRKSILHFKNSRWLKI